MQIELNPLAVANAATLRAIAETGWTQKTEISRKVGRDPKNAARDFGILEAAGLIVEHTPSGDDARPYALTQAAHDQLAAIGRAEHGGEKRKAQGRWDASKLQRNLANRPIDRTHVANLADTIEVIGDILQPIVVSPPDAHGVRTIWAGEHRWEAVKYLNNQGLLPAALTQGLPFIERTATAGEAALIAVVENTARADLTPWDDAKLLKAAADEEGLSASELARRTGRAREGSRGGLRDVQSKLKVAREASPEAIAEYERDPAAPGAWERLRDSVSLPKARAATDFDSLPLTKTHGRALAELYAKAGRRIEHEVAILPAAFQAEGGRLQHYELAGLRRNDKGDGGWVTKRGLEYLRHCGFLDPDFDTLADRAAKADGGWTTAWLNTLAKGDAAATKPDSEVEALTGIEAVGPRAPWVAGQPYTRRFDRHKPRRTVEQFAPDLPFPADSWISPADPFEPNSFTTWSLPHRAGAGQHSNGYPAALIEVACLRGGRGWVYGAGYSTNDVAHHERLCGVHRSKEAFADQETAIAAGIDLIRDSLGRMTKWKLTASIAAWLEAMEDPDVRPTPDDAAIRAKDPLVVNGIRFPNATRAAEARRLAGIDPNPSNSGGGLSRRADPAADPVDSSPPHPLAVAGPQSHPTNAALQLIAVERARQVDVEGYRPADDDLQNGDLELAFAAAAYCLAYAGEPTPGEFWPAAWDQEAFKPGDCEARCLVKAGALIVAELERLQRVGLA